MTDAQRKEHATALNLTAIIIALVATIPPTVASIASVIISMQTEAKVEKVHEKVEAVAKATNGLGAKLEAVTRSDALQEGHTKGVSDEKVRQLERKGVK